MSVARNQLVGLCNKLNDNNLLAGINVDNESAISALTNLRTIFLNNIVNNNKKNSIHNVLYEIPNVSSTQPYNTGNIPNRTSTPQQNEKINYTIKDLNTTEGKYYKDAHSEYNNIINNPTIVDVIKTAYKDVVDALRAVYDNEVKLLNMTNDNTSAFNHNVQTIITDNSRKEANTKLKIRFFWILTQMCTTITRQTNGGKSRRRRSFSRTGRHVRRNKRKSQTTRHRRRHRV